MARRDEVKATDDQEVRLHLLIDAWGSPSGLLDDPAGVRAAILEAVDAAGASLIDLCVHEFNPQGLTAVATLAESHLAIHTWPEAGYFAADLFFCGRGDSERAVAILAEALGATEVNVQRVVRGAGSPAAAEPRTGDRADSTG